MFDGIAKLEKALLRYPRAPLFARVADHYLKRGKILRALALCREGCERFPDYSTGHAVLSRCYEAQGEFEKARASLDRSLRLDPDNAGGFVRLSDIYDRLGIPTLALKSMQQAAALDPFSDEVAAEVARLNRDLPAETVTAPVSPAAESGTAAVADPPEAPAVPGAEEAMSLTKAFTLGAVPHDESVDDESVAEGEEETGLFNDGDEAQAVEDAPQDAPEPDETAESDDPTDIDEAEETASEARSAQDPDPQDEPAGEVEASVDDVAGAGEEESPFAVPDKLEPADMEASGTEDVVEDEAVEDEPFAQVKPMPEWDEAPAEPESSPPAPSAPVEEPAAPPSAPSPPPAPAIDDEVAALGAGLFDDEETASPAEPEIEDTGETEAPETVSVEAVAPPGLDETAIPAETMTPVETEQAPVEIDRPADQGAPVTVPAASGLEVTPSDSGESVAESEAGVDQNAPVSEPAATTEASAASPSDSATASESEGAAEPEASAEKASSASSTESEEQPSRVSRLSRTDDGSLLEVFREIESDSVDDPQDGGAQVEAEVIEPVPTATLAELYSTQGFAERAADTYRLILRDDPRNEAAASRLAELTNTTHPQP